jgi:predicted phage-related endonuclease
MLDDGSVVDLTPYNWPAVELPERAQLKAEIGERERRVAEIDNHIKLAMGTATYAHCPGWAITYRSHQRAERVLPAATIRTLRVSAKEEESI